MAKNGGLKELGKNIAALAFGFGGALIVLGTVSVITGTFLKSAAGTLLPTLPPPPRMAPLWQIRQNEYWDARRMALGQPPLL